MSRSGMRNMDSHYCGDRSNSRSRYRNYSRSRSRSRDRSISYSRRDSPSGSWERTKRYHRQNGYGERDLYRDLISEDYSAYHLDSYSKSRNNYHRRDDKRDRKCDREKRSKNYERDYRERMLDKEQGRKRSRDHRSASYSNGTGNGNEAKDESNHESGKHNAENYESEESDDCLVTRNNINTSNEAFSQIVLLGLKKNITEADITAELMNLNLEPNSVRLMRSKSTGASRGFAFVKFNTVEEASHWMELTKGTIMLGDRSVTLKYSLTDWSCAKCGLFNFKHRSACFSCSASRAESEFMLLESSEGIHEVSSILTKKIMLRFLDALTTEEGVLTALQTVLPNLAKTITKLQISRDSLTNTSRGICYLHFETLVDSMEAHNALTALDPPLRIDDRDVDINYCMEAEPRVVQPKASKCVAAAMPPVEAGGVYTLADVPRLAEYSASLYASSTAEHAYYVNYYTDYYKNEILNGRQQVTEANSGAAVALSAMQRQQMKTSGMETSATVATQAAAMVKATFSGQSKVPPKGNDGAIYPTPNVSQYQFDATSGYFYDPSTGLYYDAHSQYYYNNETGAYLYWDQKRSTYIRATPATTHAALQETLAQAAKYDEKHDDAAKEGTSSGIKHGKVNVAKKIVKDMQKWAQQLNHKKGCKDVTIPESDQPVEEANTSRAADVGFSILQKKENGKISDWVPLPGAAPVIKLVNAYGGDTDSEEDNGSVVATSITAAGEGRAVEMPDYVDFQNLTCLLCKRVFQSSVILQKHLKLSILHKENLAKHNMNGFLEDNNVDEPGLLYRDRAKERRLKYGEGDTPPPNPCRELFDEIKNSHTRAKASVPASALPISSDNVGNRLLQKMGWSEGQGLGRKNQGRTQIIESVARSNNEGLGSNKSADNFGVDYKTYIKKMMQTRYDNG